VVRYRYLITGFGRPNRYDRAESWERDGWTVSLVERAVSGGALEPLRIAALKDSDGVAVKALAIIDTGPRLAVARRDEI
jgi:hypothetical protein